MSSDERLPDWHEWRRDDHCVVLYERRRGHWVEFTHWRHSDILTSRQMRLAYHWHKKHSKLLNCGEGKHPND